MDRLSALSRGSQIMLGAAILLLIDTFLPWQKFGTDEQREVVEAIGGDLSPSAWRGFLGWVLGLLLIVLLAWLVVRIASVNVPLPVSTAMTAGLLGTLILFFAVLKNIVDDESTIWSYIGVLLALALAYGAWLQIQEAGGIDTLKTEASSMRPPTSAPTDTSPPSGTTTPTAPSSAPTTPTDPPASPPPSTAPPSPPPPGDTPPASGGPTS